MQYSTIGDFKISRFGVGTKRMPTTDVTRVVRLDLEEASSIFSAAVDEGITFFDTSYSNHKGEAEAHLGDFFQEHDAPHQIATNYFDLVDPRYEYVFQKQMKKLYTNCIDFYTIESITDMTMERDVQSGALDHLFKMKEEGHIANFGFSCDFRKPENLLAYAKRFPWDYIRMTINYYDWFMRGGEELFAAAKETGLPIISHGSMHTGTKSQLKSECISMLKEANPDRSSVDWAFRFVKSLEDVKCVTANLYSAKQVKEDAAVFQDDVVLSSTEFDLLKEVAAEQKAFRR